MRTQVVKYLLASVAVSTPYVAVLVAMYLITSRWLSSFQSFYSEFLLVSGFVELFEKTALVST